MRERKSLLLLIAIMITTCLAIAGTAITILYQTGIKGERERLMETAQSQARLIESIARFNKVFNKNYPKGAKSATLSQIIDAHKHYTGFGETGEFTLSEKEGENIVFLLRHRHYDRNKPKPVPFESELAEPMQRALFGQSGTIVGLDYRGKKVLAAYEPVSELNLGIVAKIDMSEVRSPYVRAGLITVFFIVLFVSVSTILFVRVTNPMIGQLEKRALELKKLNKDMEVEINERKQVEEALRSSERETSIRHRISDTFLAVSDENVYSEVLNVVMEATGSNKGYFGYVEENGDLVSPSLTKDIWDQCMIPDKTIVFPRNSWSGLWGKSLLEKKTLYSNDPLSVPEGHIPLNRALAVPILFQNELIGQIVVANKETDYDQEDINLLKSIVDSMAPILKARLQRDFVERKRRRAEEALKSAHDELEQQVKERTAELTKANKDLKQEIEDRKRAENAVRKSEERYALAVAGSTDGIWDWDIPSDTVFYSERFREFLGYSFDEFPGTVDAFRSSLHPDDAGTVWTAVERHLRERVPYNIQYRMQTKQGEDRWFHARGQAIWDDRGAATRMSGSIQDITDAKRAEKALRESEEKYRLLIKMLPSVVYKGYKDWAIEFFGEKIESFIGYDVDKFNSYKMKWCDVILKEDIPVVKEKFVQALKTDKKFVREYRIKTHSGEILWIQDRGHIVCDNQGAVEYISGVFFDITDQKLQNEKLQKSKKLLQSVFDGIPDPLILMDDRLKVKIVNQAAIQYYQIKNPEDIHSKCCYEALTGKSTPCDGCQVPAAVASRKSGTFERRGIMNPNNLEQVNIYHFDEKGHDFGGALMRIHDITEKRLMERKMVQNEKLALLGFAISCISHEITNPISAVTFNAPILKDYINAMISIVDDVVKDREDFELFQMPYPQFRKDAFKIMANILHASQRVQTIVSDLRKVYGNQKQEKEKHWVDLKQVIERTTALVGVEIGEYVKSFETNIPEKLPEIFTDPDAVEHILTNLLINAAHAADKEDSHVKLEVSQGTSWKDNLIVKISDNGCGMDQETMSKIFDPFFSTKATGRGTGLGLYVCQDLVKDLGGRIEVQSEPGNGSVFSVVLPDIERRAVKRV